ncbi:hypothetical protein J6590_083778 [Homalodisca vitripennis]|nr:hypothetical protein J6590_083778 [Homalodisca vitripennis]
MKKMQKKSVLNAFNLMASSDEQDTYLSGLISVVPVARRRNRKPEEEARKNEATYKYRVRGRIEGETKEYDVCKKAFVSFHGIGKKRVERIVAALKDTGFSPKNRRGKHENRPHKISDEVLDKIRTHISHSHLETLTMG